MRIKHAMRWLLGILLLAAGANHFANPEFYESVMPPWLPRHRELVAISGVAEIFLGGLILIPRFVRVAAWGVIALLVAVFPANLHMAFNPDQFPQVPPLALWLRLPLQGILIAWAYWFTRRSDLDRRNPTSHDKN
jgi:uncharacterized membrane protein